MKRQVLIIINLLSLVLLVAIANFYFQDAGIQHETHLHAGFQVYVDGVKQDFSDYQYMEIQPCGITDYGEKTPEEQQLEKAHLHDGVGDVVHVHRAGATWGGPFPQYRL